MCAEHALNRQYFAGLDSSYSGVHLPGILLLEALAILAPLQLLFRSLDIHQGGQSLLVSLKRYRHSKVVRVFWYL